MDHVRTLIEMAAASIEALAVAIMVGFIAVVTVRWLFHTSQRKASGAYERYRVSIGKALLVGLELLVAADIIRTVALDASLINVAILSALVLVRTFLGWTLTVEVEGRWPWQQVPLDGDAVALRDPGISSRVTAAASDLPK
jgi:uncharacterized membrane protein